MNKPNILIFMTDQQRARSIYPFSEAKTPNINKFCKEGITFSNMQTTAPHCCPSRASFFTGLYPSEHGVWNNIGVGNTLSKGLYDGVRLFSEDLKEQGYKLFFNGKWHVSYYDRPQDRGFDHISPKRNYIKIDKEHKLPQQERWADYDHFYHTDNREDGELYREGYPKYVHYGSSENPYNDNGIIEEALKLFDQHDDTPWCHYIGTIGPHDPYAPPQKYLDMYDIDDIELPDNFYDDLKDKPNLYRRTQDRFKDLGEAGHKKAILHYLAYCSYEDDLFAQIMKALDRSGQKDNTFVIFTSDHGDYMGEHGLWCKGLPCFKSGYHIPAVMRWPDVITKDQVIDDMVSITDFSATLLDIIGVDNYTSGKSLMGYVNGNQDKPLHQALYTQTNGNELYGIQRSITTDEWKYVYNGFDYDELYHLKEDPHELVNLAQDESYRYVIKSLLKDLWSFAKTHKDVCINPYIMVSLAPFGPGIINE